MAIFGKFARATKKVSNQKVNLNFLVPQKFAYYATIEFFLNDFVLKSSKKLFFIYYKI